MLQYLVILLDDTSTSYCHYKNTKTERHLISIDDLKAGVFWGMKENLMIQFVYPDYELPQDYQDVIETIDHSKIMPSSAGTNDADVIVFNNWKDLVGYTFKDKASYVLRASKEDLFAQQALIKSAFNKVSRLNVVVTDMETFTDGDFERYKAMLAEWGKELAHIYAGGGSIQLNLLTDRMMLDEMNNCGAGVNNITLAPDGKFYVCPAFYYTGECDNSEISLGEQCQKGYSVGSLKDGLDIKNQQLYQFDHAPLCRKCDAYQCKRCVWLNRKTTYEVNTPSREQCVMAHIERNASRELLAEIRKHGAFMPNKEIKEIEYLDPFEVKDSLDANIVNDEQR